MNPKLLAAFALFLLVSVSFVIAQERCDVGVTLEGLRKALYTYYTSPEESAKHITTQELRDMLAFYVSIKSSEGTVDCTNTQSSLADKGIILLDTIPTCSDGTKYGKCNYNNKPMYCYAGNLVPRCRLCGCPVGQWCDPNYVYSEKGNEGRWGKCYAGTNVSCAVDTDCGISEYTGDYYCQEGDVYRNYVKHACLNPGEASSQCKEETVAVLIDDCQEGEECVGGQSVCQTVTPPVNLTCSDGTLHEMCSVAKPKYCNNGLLIDNCQVCGCEEGLACVENSCVPAVWEKCSQCGSGFFNTCDKEECSAISETCYYVSGLVGGNCYACSGIESCESYSDEMETCVSDVCNLGTCEWGDTCLECDFDKDNSQASSCGGYDCDDKDANVYPSAFEVCENSIDDNCNGFVNENCLCSQQDGYVCEEGKTCPGINLDASDVEKCCSQACITPTCNLCNKCGAGLFNVCDREECQTCTQGCYFVDGWISDSCYACSSIENCNSYKDELSCKANTCNVKDCMWVGGSCVGCDQDNDGYLSMACGGNDCDDTNANIRPNVPDVCDGKDNDCNVNTVDGSGEAWYGQQTTCGVGKCAGNKGVYTCMSGAKTNMCNPYGGAVVESCEYETGYDKIDNNCDGMTDLDCSSYCDQDKDGYSSHTICLFGGYSIGDCDDTNAAIHPGGTEVCGNGIDEDCNGADTVCTCSDGTLYTRCSITKPKYCENGILIDKCQTCSCETGKTCQTNGSCITPTCSDGTLYGQCSTTKPQYCSSGTLINNCVSCGCDTGTICNPTSGSCYVTNEKPYTSDGNTVLLYHFDEGSGTTVYDSSSYSNNGGFGDATWTTDGKFGSALCFDGKNDLIAWIGDPPSLRLGTSFTLEAWVRVAPPDGKNRGVVIAKDGGGNGYGLSVDVNADKVNMWVGSTGNAFYGTKPISYDEWHHIAGVRDGNNVRLYVDGKQDAISSSPLPDISNIKGTDPSPHLLIGSLFGCYNAPCWKALFQGCIDEIRISNTARTSFNVD